MNMQQETSKKSVQLSEWDRNCMAYHEAGHAVCSYFLSEMEEITRISIEPTSDAFGVMRTVARPHHNNTEQSLLSSIVVAFAGPLAEELILNIKSHCCPVKKMNQLQKVQGRF